MLLEACDKGVSWVFPHWIFLSLWPSQGNSTLKWEEWGLGGIQLHTKDWPVVTLCCFRMSYRVCLTSPSSQLCFSDQVAFSQLSLSRNSQQRERQVESIQWIGSPKKVTGGACWCWWGSPGGTNGKEFTCQGKRCKRCRFDPWVRKIPWRRKWQPTSVFFPGESHGQRSLAGYRS